MIKVDQDVFIARDPQAVFDFITQPERYPEWQREGGITGARRTSEGRVGVGGRFVLERTARGKMVPIDCEVTAHEPGRRFAFRAVDADGFVGDFESLLTPSGEGTNLRWSVRMQPPNLLYKLLQPVIRRSIAKSAEKDFPELKAQLESAAPVRVV